MPRPQKGHIRASLHGYIGEHLKEDLTAERGLNWDARAMSLISSVNQSIPETKADANKVALVCWSQLMMRIKSAEKNNRNK